MKPSSSMSVVTEFPGGGSLMSNWTGPSHSVPFSAVLRTESSSRLLESEGSSHQGSSFGASAFNYNGSPMQPPEEKIAELGSNVAHALQSVKNAVRSCLSSPGDAVRKCWSSTGNAIVNCCCDDKDYEYAELDIDAEQPLEKAAQRRKAKWYREQCGGKEELWIWEVESHLLADDYNDEGPRLLKPTMVGLNQEVWSLKE
jgi:hypothetical protein